jgi:hypothetical protein
MSEINAIATNNYLLATQQEVSHDNTLSGNGTVDSPLGVVPGYNETVLWSGTRTSAVETSESMKNFENCQLYLAHGTYGPPQVYTIDFADMNTTGYFVVNRPRGSNNLNLASIRFSADDTHLTVTNAKCLAVGPWTSTATTITGTFNEDEDVNSIIRVIGINRK